MRNNSFSEVFSIFLSYVFYFVEPFVVDDVDQLKKKRIRYVRHFVEVEEPKVKQNASNAPPQCITLS
jgi:hypothetical protein